MQPCRNIIIWKEKIMVIEDEEFNVSIMKQMLKKASIDPESRVDYALNG
jgi:hypothetical protein